MVYLNEYGDMVLPEAYGNIILYMIAIIVCTVFSVWVIEVFLMNYIRAPLCLLIYNDCIKYKYEKINRVIQA
jgi:hypothetical protein